MEDTGTVGASSSEKRIVLAIATDEVNAMPLSVSLSSALMMTRDSASVDAHVLSFRISSRSRRLIEESFEKHACGDSTLRVHAVDRTHGGLLQKLFLHSDRPYPPANYARLVMADILPNSTDRVVYLDTDTLVRRDISQLWNLGNEANELLAVRDLPATDQNSKRILDTLNVSDKEEYSVSMELDYFQAGVLLISLRSLREGRFEEIIRLLKAYPALTFPDQDALNIVFGRNCRLIDPRWNQMSSVYWYKSWKDSPYDEETFTALRDEPWIIHYSGRPKPWEDGCDHPLAHHWHDVFAQTPWASEKRTLVTRIRDRVPRAQRVLGKKVYRALGLHRR